MPWRVHTFSWHKKYDDGASLLSHISIVKSRTTNTFIKHLPCCLSGHVALWVSSLHTISKPENDFFSLASNRGSLGAKKRNKLGQRRTFCISVCFGNLLVDDDCWSLSDQKKAHDHYIIMNNIFAFVSRELIFFLSYVFNGASLFSWYFAISFFFQTLWLL